MMIHFIMTLSLFKAPSSGGAFPFQRPAEIVGLPPFDKHTSYLQRRSDVVSAVLLE